MSDNSTLHRTVDNEEPLESKNIQRIDQPAKSLELYMTEHMWNFLRRCKQKFTFCQQLFLAVISSITGMDNDASTAHRQPRTHH